MCVTSKLGRSKDIWNDFFFLDMSVLDDENRKNDFQVLYDRKSVNPVGVAVASVMYEFSGFNVPKIHLPQHITDFQPTGTNLRSLTPSSRLAVSFSPETINDAMLTLSKGYCPRTSYSWEDALKVLLTLTTDALRFTIAKQFIANSLKLGKGKFLSIPNDMKIITSNWDNISKQIWVPKYPITLTDSSYSGGPISKTEAYNMVSLLSGDSEKAMTKPGDNEDPWANKKRSNRKNQLSSTVEETTDLAVEASSFMLGSQNLDLDQFFDAVLNLKGWANKIHGLTVPADGSYHVQKLHEPIGVAGQIIPWHSPSSMFAWKVGPALACGNSTVLITAEKTPLSALCSGNLFLEEEFPPGGLNVFSGFGPTAGAALCGHKNVDKLAFTGSIAMGKTVLPLTAASNPKPVTLELGGKSLFIVCEDTDIDKAVELMYFALFYNQGQFCDAGSQTFVHERIYDEFLHKRAVEHVVGDQIDNERFEKIFKYMKAGVENGGMRLGSKGFYVQPTVLSAVQDMLIAQDEIFGPVQSISKFRDATSFGLAAGVFTHNIDVSNTLAHALKVGAVMFFMLQCHLGDTRSLINYLQVKAVLTPLKGTRWL